MPFDGQNFDTKPDLSLDPFMRAADLIEQDPDQFNFMESEIPACGTPGCAYGWVAHFAGAAPGRNLHSAEKIVGMGPDEFYREMDRHVGSLDWQSDPALAAQGLRAVARALRGS